MIAAFINKITHDIYYHGYGNGYVAVSVDEPKLSNIVESMDEIPVHGGITFYDTGKVCMDIFEDIEWIDPEVDLNNYYVFGFDTCHYEDNLENWNREKVIEETLFLKEQIQKILND